MPRIPRANEDARAKTARIVDQTQKGSPLDSTSVSQGLTQWIGGKLQGLAGAVFEWIGTFDLTGPFTATGTSIFRGPVSITGEDGTLDVAADADFGGDVRITQTLDVTAETTLREIVTLLSDLNVEGDGAIHAGVVTIDGTSGGRVSSSGNLALVAGGGGSAEVIVTGGFHASNGSLFEGNVFMLQTLTVVEAVEFLSAMVSIPNLPTTVPSGVTGYQLIVGSNGRLYRGPAL